MYILTASAHIEPGASSIFEVRRKMQPVDLGITINLRAVINKVYVFPLPAAFYVICFATASRVSSGIGLYLWLSPPTVSSSLEPYAFRLVSTHAK